MMTIVTRCYFSNESGSGLDLQPPVIRVSPNPAICLFVDVWFLSHLHVNYYGTG